MNSRSRSIRALFLTGAVAFAFLPCGRALADLGSAADRVSNTVPSIGRSLPLTAIGDDPDVVPTIATAPVDSGGLALGASRWARWCFRVSMILSAVTGAPWPTWTPPTTAGI
jgi:hypothetical protein